MIDRLITAPLWCMIEKKGHILDMNMYYQKLVEVFKVWANDASEFMAGDVDVFSDEVEIHKGQVFNHLFGSIEGEIVMR